MIERIEEAWAYRHGLASRDGKIYLYRGTEDTAQTQDILRNS